MARAHRPCHNHRVPQTRARRQDMPQHVPHLQAQHVSALALRQGQRGGDVLLALPRRHLRDLFQQGLWGVGCVWVTCVCAGMRAGEQAWRPPAACHRRNCARCRQPVLPPSCLTHPQACHIPRQDAHRRCALWQRQRPHAGLPCRPRRSRGCLGLGRRARVLGLGLARLAAGRSERASARAAAVCCCRACCGSFGCPRRLALGCPAAVRMMAWP